MADDPRIRASDDDRDRTATLLREHHAAGRLDPEEFNERLDKVYQAKTLGELDELMSDLPAIDLYRLPDAGLSRQRPAPARPPARPPGRSSHWRGALGSWFCVSLVLVVIWALSGMGYPWFAWPVGIWGALVIGNIVTGESRSGGDHQQQHDQRRLDRDGRLDRDELGE